MLLMDHKHLILLPSIVPTKVNHSCMKHKVKHTCMEHKVNHSCLEHKEQSSGGFNMPMMHPSANVTQAHQPVQQADASNEDDRPEVEEVTIPLAHTGKGRRTKVGCRTSNFSNVEDVNLVKSWLENSTDPAIGTGQNKERLWERIMEWYNLRRETSGTPERTLRSLQSHWDLIKAEVGKISSFYADCVRENRSGTSDADKTTPAASMFGVFLGHNFAFMHCWELMKDEPKWKDPKSRLSARSAAGEGFGEDSTNAEEGSIERRPMGTDAAKAAKKKPNSSAGSVSAEYASRMKDLCLQQNAIMPADSERKQNHFQQLASLEDQRFQEMQRHNQSLLLIEKEKMRLMREKQEQDREERRRNKKMKGSLPLILINAVPLSDSTMNSFRKF